MFVAMLVLFLFLLGAAVCFGYGLPIAFAAIYVPALLMMSNTLSIDMPGMPDINPPMGVAAGIFFGLVLKGGERILFRWTGMDTIIAALACCAVLTGWMTNTFYSGVHIAGVQALDFVIPYFTARWAFHSPAARKTALITTISCLCIIALFAPVEMRLWPYYYNRLLSTIAPRARALKKALTRFGFFRAAVSFLQPIDFGNGCLVMTGMVGILASSTVVGLQNIYVQAGLAAGLMCLATSLSFGPFAACAFAMFVFFSLYWLPFSRRMLVPFVFIMAGGLIVMTFLLLKVDPHTSWSMPSLERSFRIRAVIVQNSWPFVKGAGLFGWGEKINQTTLNLKSVDNSYILLAMTKGWLYTSLWIAIPFMLAWRVQRALRTARGTLEIFALSIAVATCLGINIAMFTVWAGSIYAKVWLVMLGFSTSLTEWFLAPVIVAPARRRMMAPNAAPRPLAPANAINR
jgi:hypothetical protein